MIIQLKYSAQMRSLVGVLTRLTFVVAVILLGFTNYVNAKGPESATITGPGFDQPIDLMTDSADIDLMTQLMEQTVIWYATGTPLEEPPDELGPAYTLTWVNAGPPGKSVEERTIRQFIYLDVENGPIIHTPVQKGLNQWGPGVIGWFSVSSDLRDTLAEMGVPISAAESVSEVSMSEDVVSSEPGFPNTIWYLVVVGMALLAGLAAKMLKTVRC